MPDFMNLIYFAGSLAGIALIVALNLALFGRARFRITSLSDVAAKLAAEVPGFRAGDGIVASDGRAALCEDKTSGAIYLVEAVGNRLVTRRLGRGSLRALSGDGAGLSLRLADFTFAKSKLAFADAAARKIWEARLKAALA
ncbi:MAG TPA: hypothetical protein VLV55_03140 [Rhizomicrobium sp.]|nr:hypothetical protein [Rhizomicrobium sp.]